MNQPLILVVTWVQWSFGWSQEQTHRHQWLRQDKAFGLLFRLLSLKVLTE